MKEDISTFRGSFGGFNVNGVVFRKIFILSAGVMFGIILGVKRYADYEYLVAVAFLNV